MHRMLLCCRVFSDGFDDCFKTVVAFIDRTCEFFCIAEIIYLLRPRFNTQYYDIYLNDFELGRRLAPLFKPSVRKILNFSIQPNRLWS